VVNEFVRSINRNVLYTDGAQHVAEHGGAYWLLDEIAIIQAHNKAVAAEEFQVWKLAVRPDQTASLTCDDGDGNIVFTKEIEHTDFPLDELTLYFANNNRHPHQPANPALARCVLRTQPVRIRPLVYELHPFFAMTAFSISLSRLRSTTSFFNFVFSSRNCLASCASVTSIPPYFAQGIAPEPAAVALNQTQNPNSRATAGRHARRVTATF